MNDKTTIEGYGLVVKIARHYAKRSTADQADMIQEGLIALIEARKTFDESRGVKFSTHAWWKIRAAIQAYAMRNANHGAQHGRVGRDEFKAGKSTIKVSSFDSTTVGKEGEQRGLEEVLPSAEKLADEVLASAEVRAPLARFYAALTCERERAIWQNWASDEPESLAEIGKRFGMTKQNVSLIQIKLTKRARVVLWEMGLER